MRAASILKSVESVTKKWTKQRKAEERGSRTSRREALTRVRRTTIKDAAFEIMEEAYNKVSGNGKYPAQARQLMYAARGHILKQTGRSQLKSQYFTQNLLPQYMAHCRYREKTARWDVVYDARGHFAEPHTKMLVPIGTLDVRKYLRKIANYKVEELANIEGLGLKDLFPTCGPANRFSAVMFIEKEGFMPLFEATKLAQRYDLAIMSTKGMPVTACRHLADIICGEHDIPLLVLHDFDKAGFSILGTLQDVEHDYQLDDYGDVRGVKRYEFTHEIDVIDLGLRLEDVRTFGLESEAVSYRSDPSGNLRENGATDEEVEFLRGDYSLYGYSHSGKRVELNAFTSGDFIAWIESKLNEYGVRKVVPAKEVLDVAYRRATQTALIRARLDRVVGLAKTEASQISVPKTLLRKVRKRLAEDPALPWDKVVTEVAAANCKKRAGQRNV